MIVYAALLLPFKNNPDSLDEKEIDRKFPDLTACYERVKNEYDRKLVGQNKSVNTVVGNSVKVDKNVAVMNTTLDSPVNLRTPPHIKGTKLDALQRQIMELEIQESELSLALRRSQLNNSPLGLDVLLQSQNSHMD